jgi:hypothetical protein
VDVSLYLAVNDLQRSRADQRVEFAQLLEAVERLVDVADKITDFQVTQQLTNRVHAGRLNTQRERLDSLGKMVTLDHDEIRDRAECDRLHAEQISRADTRIERIERAIMRANAADEEQRT